MFFEVERSHSGTSSTLTTALASSPGGAVPLALTASVGGGYLLLYHYSGVAVDLAVQHGPRVAAQAARVTVSGARAVAPYFSEAVSQSWRAAIWSAQCGLGAVCAFWEWAKFSLGLHRRRQSWRRLVRSMEAGKFILISRAGEWDEVWIAAQVPGYVGATLGAEWIVRSTDNDVTRFIWCHVSDRGCRDACHRRGGSSPCTSRCGGRRRELAVRSCLSRPRVAAWPWRRH